MSLSGALIVFDLDGTLVDTAPDVIGVLNVFLTERGVAPAPLSAANRLIGGGVPRLLERAFRDAGLTLTADEAPEMVARFVELYRARVSRESRPYANVEAALDALAAQGARLAVCTNKLSDLSETLLADLGLRSRFAAVVGADQVARKKPDRLHFDETVRRAGGGPALMVGDSRTDLAAARAAGAPVVLVSYGYTETPAAELGADAVIDDFARLPAVAHELLRRDNSGLAVRNGPG